MIWVLLYPDNQPDVRAVYEAPEGVQLHFLAFLESLGLRPQSRWNSRAAAVNPDYVMDWNKDCHCWEDERDALLKEKGITDPKAAHREWIEQREDVRSVPFEDI